MNQRRLFIASCLSLVVTAMIFVIRGDIAPQVEPAFGLSHENYAFVSTMAFFGFAASIFVASPMLDALGMRNLLYLAFALHIGGHCGLHLRPELHRALYVNALCGLRQRPGRSSDQPADGDDLSRRENAQAECATCLVAGRADYRRSGRICDGASQSPVASEDGGRGDSHHHIRHTDLRAAISEDRTCGGRNLDRRNDQSGVSSRRSCYCSSA